MTALSFSQLPASVRAIWAKSGETSGHGLLAHMLDVAAAAEVLLKHEPASTLDHFARQFGLSVDAFVRYAAALAGLHDFGKAIPGFQSKWPEGRVQCESAGLKFPAPSLSVTDHARATAALLLGHLGPLGFEPTWTLGVLQALGAHHGYNFSLKEINEARPPFEPPQWKQARKVLFDCFWRTLAPPGLPATEELPLAAVEWLAGLTSVADWIGSNVDWFPLGERGDSFAGHFAEASTLAAQALKEIGWTRSTALLKEWPSVDDLVGRIVGRLGIRARALQVEGDRLLREARGPALLLVEAPMGEGKTELAFLAHLRLQALNQHRGLYVALPTQATGNALFDRAVTFLHAFGDGQRLDVQLVHGGAAMDERVQRLRGIHGEAGENVGAATWFSQRRRPMLSPYGVGTVDQALLAALNVKHHFVRLFGLANRVVVLDEVHAYDTYTSGLIDSLLRWLKAMGSSVVLMSATLPRQRRDALLTAWGVTAEAVPELTYPRMVLADERGLHGSAFGSRPLPPISLRPVREELGELAACARRLLERGGHGAVIVNTVNRAQELFRQLEPLRGEGVRLVLFHARFPADERAAREREVLEVFGKTGTDRLRPGRALLIATQVAEQSLDIDFDFLVTDLAPVDLVLQRAGRLHRHERVRPEAHAEARLFVAGLDPERLPDLKQTAWEFVYDPFVLGRTWALLGRETVLQLPHDIDRLVQAVYGDQSLPEDLPEKAMAYLEGQALGVHLARVNDQRQQAVNIALDARAEPQNAYLTKPRGHEEGDGLGLVNRTRLGDDAVTLIPVHAVPGGWSVDPHGEPFDPQQPISDSLARRLYSRQLKSSRPDVGAHFAGVEPPPAFAENPLLRHLSPLVLEDGRCVAGKTALCLDERLGLVYAPVATVFPPEEKP